MKSFEIHLLIVKKKSKLEGLEQLIKTTDNPNDAIEKLTQRSKDNILTLAYQQGKAFQNFRANNKFLSAGTEFGISKTTINFKIDVKYRKVHRDIPENEEVLYLAFLP